MASIKPPEDTYYLSTPYLNYCQTVFVFSCFVSIRSCLQEKDSKQNFEHRLSKKFGQSLLTLRRVYMIFLLS